MVKSNCKKVYNCLRLQCSSQQLIWTDSHASDTVTTLDTCWAIFNLICLEYRINLNRKSRAYYTRFTLRKARTSKIKHVLFIERCLVDMKCSINMLRPFALTMQPSSPIPGYGIQSSRAVSRTPLFTIQVLSVLQQTSLHKS